MATFRFEDGRLRLPAAASDREAAAIVAAVECALAADTAPDDEERMDPWRLAARLEGVGASRPPGGRSPPRDPWRVAGRTR